MSRHGSQQGRYHGDVEDGGKTGWVTPGAGTEGGAEEDSTAGGIFYLYEGGLGGLFPVSY